jgi:hypothetical protein
LGIPPAPSPPPPAAFTAPLALLLPVGVAASPQQGFAAGQRAHRRKLARVVLAGGVATARVAASPSTTVVSRGLVFLPAEPSAVSRASVMRFSVSFSNRGVMLDIGHRLF